MLNRHYSVTKGGSADVTMRADRVPRQSHGDVTNYQWVGANRRISVSDGFKSMVFVLQKLGYWAPSMCPFACVARPASTARMDRSAVALVRRTLTGASRGAAATRRGMVAGDRGSRARLPVAHGHRTIGRRAPCATQSCLCGWQCGTTVPHSGRTRPKARLIQILPSTQFQATDSSWSCDESPPRDEGQAV